MAKKARSPRKAAAKPKKSAKPRAGRAAGPASSPTRATPKSRPTARAAKPRASAKKTAKPSASKHRKKAAHDYVATLTAGARQLGLGLRRRAAAVDARKLLQDTGAKIRHIKFNRVTDFCKKEWRELAVLAGKLQELASHPERPTRRRAKRAGKS